MRVVAKTFRVDFVDVFGTGRTRGEPAVLGNYFDATNVAIVARGTIEYVLHFFAGKLADFDFLRRQLREFFLLLGIRTRINTIRQRLARRA